MLSFWMNDKGHDQCGAGIYEISLKAFDCTAVLGFGHEAIQDSLRMVTSFQERSAKGAVRSISFSAVTGWTE